MEALSSLGHHQSWRQWILDTEDTARSKTSTPVQKYKFSPNFLFYIRSNPSLGDMGLCNISNERCNNQFLTSLLSIVMYT